MCIRNCCFASTRSRHVRPLRPQHNVQGVQEGARERDRDRVHTPHTHDAKFTYVCVCIRVSCVYVGSHNSAPVILKNADF